MRRPIDTSSEARGRQLEAYRAMTPHHRLRLADQLSADTRALTRAGIRARLAKDASEEDVEAELARILLGPDLTAAIRARAPAGRQ